MKKVISGNDGIIDGIRLRTITIQMSVAPWFLTRRQKEFMEFNIKSVRNDIDAFVQEIKKELSRIPIDHRIEYLRVVEMYRNRVIEPMRKNQAIIAAWIEYQLKVNELYL